MVYKMVITWIYWNEEIILETIVIYMMIYGCENYKHGELRFEKHHMWSWRDQLVWIVHGERVLLLWIDGLWSCCEITLQKKKWEMKFIDLVVEIFEDGEMFWDLNYYIAFSFDLSSLKHMKWIIIIVAHSHHDCFEKDYIVMRINRIV